MLAMRVVPLPGQEGAVEDSFRILKAAEQPVPRAAAFPAMAAALALGLAALRRR
jgi:hypothetical protein